VAVVARIPCCWKKKKYFQVTATETTIAIELTSLTKSVSFMLFFKMMYFNLICFNAEEEGEERFSDIDEIANFLDKIGKFHAFF
jgi:hypothetical protein